MADFKVDQEVVVNGGKAKIVEIVPQRKRPVSKVKGSTTATTFPGKSYVVKPIGKRGKPVLSWVGPEVVSVIAE